MDVDYSKPNSSQLARDWNDFKKDYYKWFRKLDIFHYTEPKPAPCSFDINEYFFDPFFKHNQAKKLKRTSSYWLMSDLENDLIELILWEERVVSFINNIQTERDRFYRLLADGGVS